jgi:hypothetical protein
VAEPRRGTAGNINLNRCVGFGAPQIGVTLKGRAVAECTGKVRGGNALEGSAGGVTGHAGGATGSTGEAM